MMAKYKIKSGDSLSKIAKMMGTTVAAIMKANKNIKDKNKIRAGDSLTLPMGASLDGGKAAYDKKYPSKEKEALAIIKDDTNINTTKKKPRSVAKMTTREVMERNQLSSKKGDKKITTKQRLAEINKEIRAEELAKMKPKSKKALERVFKMLKSKPKKPVNTNRGGAMVKKKTKYMAKGGYGTPTKKMVMKAGGTAKKTKYMAKGGMKKTKYMAKGGAAKRK